jgi:MFS family permease
VSAHPPTGEIPLPVTGSIPVYQEPVEAQKPSKQPLVWWALIVAAGSMLTAMTFPGQTAGLSPFTDPLIESLDIDRTAISFSYLLATLTGALTMPILGRLLDKYGAKRAIIVIGFLLMTVVFLASFITDIIGLTASYVGLRMTGQGALSLAATTLIARTITHKPGLALGIVGAVGSAGISLAPVGVERLIALTDISTAWRIEALLVAIIVLPIAFLLPKDLPRTTTETGTHIVIVPESGYTSSQKRCEQGCSGCLASSGFMVGMLSTGLAFHLISILGAQGLSTLEAAANFIPQTVAAVAATLGLGAIVDRIDPRWGVAGSMLTLSGTLLILPLVTEGISGIIFGLLLGASMGALRGVEAAAFVRYYGRGHIGAIRGIATSIGLASTALGPLYFALGLSFSGSYLGASLIAAIFPLLVALGAMFVKPPPAPATLEA